VAPHLILILYGNWFSKRSDFVAESDSLWFFSINSWNHDGESLHRIRRSYFFLALSLLVHFRESLHGINRESLLSEKLFGRAPAGFSRESALGALPNGALVNCSFGNYFCRTKIGRKQLVLCDMNISRISRLDAISTKIFIQILKVFFYVGTGHLIKLL